MPTSGPHTTFCWRRALVLSGSLLVLVLLSQNLRVSVLRDDVSKGNSSSTPRVLPRNQQQLDQPSNSVTSSPASETTATSRMHYYYSAARGDRSGSAIEDMLLAHAYAYHHNATYGGACGTTRTIPDHKKLIRALGLEKELPFRCPPPVDDKHHHHHNNNNNNNTSQHEILRFATYSANNTRIWTPDWLHFIRSAAVPPAFPHNNNNNHNMTQIVVHVRRGDVSPCNRKLKRYLPNQYYLQVLNEYIPTDGRQYHVTVFGESFSFSNPVEPWTDFTQKRPHITVQLDTNVSTVWQSIMAADIFIMSKSAFSMVPALFNTNGVVVYTPYWNDPLPEWTVLPPRRREIRQEIKRLQRTMCNFSGAVR